MSEKHCPYLIHLSTENHKVCVKKLEVLVTVMHPNGICCTCGDSVHIPYEWVSPPQDGINKTVNHPTVEQHLAGVVKNHGLSEQKLDVYILRQEFSSKDSQDR
jgi:hypothetical protein